MFIDSLFSLAFASRFVVLSLLFELTSFLLRFLSFSSSAILFSMFNPRGRFTVIWDCYLKSGSTSFAIYFAFNFGFIFVLSLVNTLRRFHHWGLYWSHLVTSATRFPTLCALGGFLTDILYRTTSNFNVNKFILFNLHSVTFEFNKGFNVLL